MPKDDNFDDIENELFGDGEPVTEEPVIDEPATPIAEETPKEDVVVETEPKQPVEAAQTPVEGQEAVEVEPTTHDGMIAYGAYASTKEKLHKTREDKEAALAEKAKLQAELEAIKVRQQVESQMKAEPTPDPIDDPQKHAQWLQGQLAKQANDTRLQMSEFMARQTLGNEKVDAATTAFMAVKDTQPWVAARIQSAQSPHAEAVKWHEEQQILLAAQQQAANPQPQPTQGAPIAPQQSITAQPVIPPNNATRVSAMPNKAEPTWDDIESDLWGR